VPRSILSFVEFFWRRENDDCLCYILREEATKSYWGESISKEMGKQVGRYRFRELLMVLRERLAKEQEGDDEKKEEHESKYEEYPLYVIHVKIALVVDGGNHIVVAECLNTHDAEKETDEKDHKDGDRMEESESAFTMVCIHTKPLLLLASKYNYTEQGPIKNREAARQLLTSTSRSLRA
jgi:hypothetical protein